MAASFVHLHLHTEYSTLDGATRIGELAARTAELEMPAVAMTDHGNLFGAVPFWQNCRDAGVKPIFGCEIYLAPGSMDEKKEIVGRKRACHMTLLAETNEGYSNLTKLVSKGHVDGLYYGKPRVDREQLRKFSKGIICLSGCISGPVNEWILLDEPKKAREQMAELVDIYGKPNVYVEIHRHGLEIQQKVEPVLLEIAKEMDLPVVAANDVHFLRADDHEAHDALICIGTGKQVFDAQRMRYPTSVYLKTAEEMRELFADIPGACDATLEIAERCNVEMHLDPTSSDKYPVFESPDGSPREEYFEKFCYEGLEKRYGKERADTDTELRERLQYEIDTINQLGFASYFLITADFIKWARDHDIPVGPGRGSAAGSLVAYVMWITDICPMRFGLLFERFLNPERVSPPDVDIDFCQGRRMEVIDYVRRKYGESCVSHIITYGKLGAKSVIRDVGRVMGIPYGEADRISKMIEAKPGVKLKEEYDEKEELRELIESNSTYQDLWSLALRLEGLVRNTGVHAAGVVIGDRSLDEHVPLSRAAEGEIVAQADMASIEQIGLLKMDFLGLKNLTVIQEAVTFIRQKHPDFVIETVPLDDAPTFKLLNEGLTMGVFQLESGGMVETCKKYGMDRIEDIIDLLALYRPGAMQFIDQMIEVKRGKPAAYLHPLLEEVCGDTFGVMIYQEQVQNAAKKLAGYTLGGADLLRRAMGKKKKSVMDEQRQIFVKGCGEFNNIDPKLADQIFDLIASFAGYGFNKSHSACYGHISYWTAYLKANFPVEFLAALLSNEIQNTDKIAVFVAECHTLGIEILPPDLNRSQLRFAPEQTPTGVKAIRYGLSAIKNVGAGAMAAAIKEREANGLFKSMEDVANRLDSKSFNKRILENLIKGGAMDWTYESRASLFSRVEKVVASASSAQKDRDAGQVSLFDAMDLTAAPPAPTGSDVVVAEWTMDERLEHEKELLGYYMSGHPLDRYRGIIDKARYNRLGLLEDIEIDPQNRRQRFPFAGMIRSIEARRTKTGKDFGILVLEDFTGSAEFMMWEESYKPARDNGLLEAGKVIRVQGAIQVDDRTGGRRLTASDVKELKPRKSTPGAAKNAFELTLWVGRHGPDDLARIRDVATAHPGRTPLVISVVDGRGRKAVIETSDDFKIRRTATLEKEMAPWIAL